MAKGDYNEIISVNFFPAETISDECFILMPLANRLAVADVIVVDMGGGEHSLKQVIRIYF